MQIFTSKYSWQRGVSTCYIKRFPIFRVKKILNTRLFGSDERRWSLSVVEQGYEVLCLSQITLYHSFKGNRLDFHTAMAPAQSLEFYQRFLEKMRNQYLPEKIKGFDQLLSDLDDYNFVWSVGDLYKLAMGVVLAWHWSRGSNTQIIVWYTLLMHSDLTQPFSSSTRFLLLRCHNQLLLLKPMSDLGVKKRQSVRFDANGVIILQHKKNLSTVMQSNV